MAIKKVKIKNEAGIHCRPSSRIMQKVLDFPECSFNVKSSRGEADLTSILSLMSLGLEQEDEVTIIVNGPDEEKACEEIAELFGYEFDFPPRM